MTTVTMTSPGGLLLVLAVLLPFMGMMVGLVAGGRHVARVAAVVVIGGVAVAVAAARAVLYAPLSYLLGGWLPPLGIALRADGPAATMMAVIAIVIAGIALYARHDFAVPTGAPEARAPLAFWLLLLAVWGSLDLVFVSGDLFTLYVGVELLTFAAVPLVCLDGRGETLRAALRYLLFALLGSMLYLLGTVLMFGAYGTLDIELLAHVVQPGTITWASLALMTVGLLAKTALFPLHIWLPPAHAGAPAAASAVLSALVIKGSWFLVVRLWFDVMPAIVTFGAAQLLGALGTAAIIVGSIVALRQHRLKLLVAYSTIAQIGYLFLMFPLAFDTSRAALVHGDALAGGVLQAASHATAKAGMFMAAGLIYAALGHDRIADLGGIARALPVTVLAFGVAGLALMGVLPSGAYVAKKLLLDASAAGGQWWWTVVLQGGAAFTAGYVVLVLTRVLGRSRAPLQLEVKVPRCSEYAALALAVLSLLLGFAGVIPGADFSIELISAPFAPTELLSTLLVLMGGTALAAGLARCPLVSDRHGALYRAAAPICILIESTDALLRRWRPASLALIMLAAAFGWLLYTGYQA